jgi:hypothetical protein
MLVGFASGAAMALLYTPRSARRTLELLESRGINVRGAGKAVFQGQRERIQHATDEARRAAQRTRDEMMNRYQASRGQPPADS